MYNKHYTNVLIQIFFFILYIKTISATYEEWMMGLIDMLKIFVAFYLKCIS